MLILSVAPGLFYHRMPPQMDSHCTLNRAPDTQCYNDIRRLCFWSKAMNRLRNRLPRIPHWPALIGIMLVFVAGFALGSHTEAIALFVDT